MTSVEDRASHVRSVAPSCSCAARTTCCTAPSTCSLVSVAVGERKTSVDRHALGSLLQRLAAVRRHVLDGFEVGRFSLRIELLERVVRASRRRRPTRGRAAPPGSAAAGGAAGRAACWRSAAGRSSSAAVGDGAKRKFVGDRSDRSGRGSRSLARPIRCVRMRRRRSRRGASGTTATARVASSRSSSASTAPRVARRSSSPTSASLRDSWIVPAASTPNAGPVSNSFAPATPLVSLRRTASSSPGSMLGRSRASALRTAASAHGRPAKSFGRKSPASASLTNVNVTASKNPAADERRADLSPSPAPRATAGRRRSRSCRAPGCGRSRRSRATSSIRSVSMLMSCRHARHGDGDRVAVLQLRRELQPLQRIERFVGGDVRAEQLSHALERAA